MNNQGIIVIKQAISSSLIQESVEDIWNTIVSLPWVPEKKELWQEIKNSIQQDYWRTLTQEEANLGIQNYPMTGGFGALTLPPFFNLTTQWKVRQEENIVNAFRQAYGQENLMVAIDRVSFKFPGQGETEFIHWDSNPYEWPNEPYEGYQGFLALSKTSFFAVPNTHTMSFREEFIENYPPVSRKDQYLVKKNQDPLNLQKKVVEYSLESGDLVIWSNRLLHEARKNTTNTIRYGYYITYFPHGQPHPTVLQQYKKKKIDWLNDRIHSYETGMNPRFFPSGTEVKLWPKANLMYHPDKLNNFCDMFICGNEIYIYKTGSKKGQTVKLPIEWNPRELGFYKPPHLTDLGKKLLGY